MTWDFGDLAPELAARVERLVPVFIDSDSASMGARLQFENEDGTTVIWFPWWDRFDEVLAKSLQTTPHYLPNSSEEVFNDEDQGWEIYARHCDSDVLVLVTNYPHDAQPSNELRNPTDGRITSFVRVDVEECRRSWSEAITMAKKRRQTRR